MEQSIGVATQEIGNRAVWEAGSLLWEGINEIGKCSLVEIPWLMNLPRCPLLVFQIVICLARSQQGGVIITTHVVIFESKDCSQIFVLILLLLTIDAYIHWGKLQNLQPCSVCGWVRQTASRDLYSLLLPCSSIYKNNKTIRDGGVAPPPLLH